VTAQNLHRFAGAFLGFVDLIPFSSQRAAALGLEPKQYYLFRLEDFALVPVQPLLPDLISNMAPNFEHLTPREVSHSRRTIFGITVDLMTEDVVETLAFLGSLKLNWSVGYLQSPLHNFVNISIGGTLEKSPSFAIFNPVNRTFAPVSPELNAMLRNGSSDLFPALKSFLADLPPFRKVSQKVPVAQNRTVIELVGRTYREFVNTDQDVIVLYTGAQTLEIKRWFRLLQKVSEKLEGAGISSLKLGAINMTANTVPFPEILSTPQLELFPAGHKDRHHTFYGRCDVAALLRFIKRYASARIGVDVPEMTEREVKFEQMQIAGVIDSLGVAERLQAFQRLSELKETLVRIRL
jgi:hypothetical protein